jgi:hypothetical protein
MSNLLKIPPLKASCFVLTNGWKSERTHMAMLIVAFRNFAFTKTTFIKTDRVLNPEHLFPITDAIQLQLYTS